MSWMLQQVINGLSIGCIYALLALGYTMVYGVLRMINFAHSELFMAGSMFALGALRYMGVVAGHLNTVSVPLTAVQLAAVLVVLFWLSAAFSGVLGMAIERLIYRRVLKVSAAGVTISALGLSTLLQNAAMSSDLIVDETCFTEVTVDWTTNTSTPASAAIAPNRSASCGIDETAHTTPPFFISSTRRLIRFSSIGL